MLALAFALLAAVAFRDPVDCIVQGYVYASATEPSFYQETCTLQIHSEGSGDSFVLYSPHVWVRFAYPQSGGQLRFQYQWGKDHAQVGGKVYPLDWGWVLGG
jgi:hypothetical protein